MVTARPQRRLRSQTVVSVEVHHHHLDAELCIDYQ